MAYVLHNGHKESLTSASAIADKRPVKLDTVESQVVLCATSGHEPLGFTIASAAQGGALAVHGRDNVVKAVAAASLGYGAKVGVASTNGALGPVAAASGVVTWAVGEARGPAAAGETFSVRVNPEKLDAQV